MNSIGQGIGFAVGCCLGVVVLIVGGSLLFGGCLLLVG